jgi:hypothetical protein
MSSRNKCLLPRATLHSDSEQEDRYRYRKLGRSELRPPLAGAIRNATAVYTGFDFLKYNELCKIAYNFTFLNTVSTQIDS